ncbi:MAG TPA: permease prefix domain 1-containing protein [Candidatus Limnocylindrales bacterium]
MTTLTDRYVWGVLRAVPARQREELEPEIRALVADAVEARQAAGTPPADAERAALIELGDPALLAARYSDRSLVLIGPQLYPEWRRLLTLLLPIVVPIVTVVTVAAAAIAGQEPAQLVGTGIVTALNVTVQTAFWFTLVFAMIERAGALSSNAEPWTPDRLPPLPRPMRPGLAETVVVVVAIGIGIALLVWQQLARPIVVGGTGYPLFNPDLWSFWMPWFIGLFVIEAVFAVVLWRGGGYTWTLAALNLVLGLAFAIPAVRLIQDGTLFDPGLTAALTAQGYGSALAPLGSALALLIVVVQTIDILDGFRKAARRDEQPGGA